MDERIKKVIKQITDIASGKFGAPLALSNEHDDLDALCAGVNMLAEELNARESGSLTYSAQIRHFDRIRAMGEAASSLAHELRSPLSTLSMQTQISLGRNDLDETSRQDLETIARAVSRMSAMISNSLEFAAPISERGEVKLERVIERLRPFLAVRLRHSGIKFKLDLAPDLPALRGREVEIGQVLVNLVDNAMQMMAEADTQDPQVLISGRQDAKRLVVVVQDNGPGFVPEAAESAFDDFVTTRHGRLGLGLGICRRIVEEHGGTISIESATDPTRVMISFELQPYKTKVRPRAL